MRITTRFLRLADLRVDAQVEYEDAVGKVHRAIITCAKRGIRAKTLLPDGGYSTEHALYATNITRIVCEEAQRSAPGYQEGDKVSVCNDDFEGEGFVIRQLTPEEFDGDGARCYAVRLVNGTQADVFDYEIARV